ncbi:MAG: DoxX family protein [Alphaproteobacteria bacterium]
MIKFLAKCPVDKYFGTIEFLEKHIRPFLDFVIRVWMAHVFLSAGIAKVMSFSSTVLLFSEAYHVPGLPPETFVILSIVFEIVFPIMLILGLGTRFAALPLLLMTAVVEFCMYSHVEHLYWAILLTRMLVRGPGHISLDYFIRRNLLRYAGGKAIKHID